MLANLLHPGMHVEKEDHWKLVKAALGGWILDCAVNVFQQVSKVSEQLCMISKSCSHGVASNLGYRPHQKN